MQQAGSRRVQPKWVWRKRQQRTVAEKLMVKCSTTTHRVQCTYCTHQKVTEKISTSLCLPTTSWRHAGEGRWSSTRCLPRERMWWRDTFKHQVTPSSSVRIHGAIWSVRHVLHDEYSHEYPGSYYMDSARRLVTPALVGPDAATNTSLLLLGIEPRTSLNR